MSYRKLRRTTLGPALVSLLVVALLLWWLLPRVLVRTASDQLRDTAKLLLPQVSRQIEQADPTELQNWTERLPGGGELRVTLIAPQGEVLADSARTNAQVEVMDNHANRPEVLRARVEGEGISVRTSATTGRSYVYLARSVEKADGPAFVLRLAQPLDVVNAVRKQIAVALAIALAVALLALAAASWWLDRRLIKPLSGLIEDAGRLAGGDFAHRVAIPDEEPLSNLAAGLNRLAAGVTEQMASTEAERDHLQSILARMSEGVLVVDSTGRASSINPAFVALFGLDGAPVGLSAREISRQPQLHRLVESTLATGEGDTTEITLAHPERRTVLLTSASLGGEAGAVVVARDTTAFNRLTEVRRDFVANVSHELKTPLAAIRGFAETLSDGVDDPATAHRFMDRILIQCGRLQALLDDLLTLSRLESVDALPEREEIDLAKLATLAAEMLQQAAEKRRVEIRLELSPLPALYGDADSLERLLLNLLGNGVKYNRPGGSVTLKLQQVGGSAEIAVSDTGIGIPEELHDRLFERFYRVDKGRSREEGGTGLGLAIVKHTAQMHGGTVEVESQEDTGTTFRVRLPLTIRSGQSNGPLDQGDRP